MTPTETLITIITSGTAMLLLRETLPGIWKWITGRQYRERTLLQQAYADLDAAQQARDAEMAARRRAEEELHALRQRVIAAQRQDLLLPVHWPSPTPIDPDN